MEITNIPLKLLLMSVFIIGCEKPANKNVDQEESESDFVMTKTLKRVKAEYDLMRDSDKEDIYKQFSGSYLFLKTNKSIKKTSDFDPILGRVQSDYGWNREKYPEFTEAVSDFLLEQGYDEPKVLDNDDDREWFCQIFYSLYMAIKNE